MSLPFNRAKLGQVNRQRRLTLSPPSMSLSKSQIHQWRRFIEAQIGFVLPNEQLGWLVCAVETTARLAELSFDALWLRIKTDAKLRQTLLDEVLILESRFFRHPPSIDFIVDLAKSQPSCPDPINTEVANSDLLNSRCQNQPLDHQQPFQIWSLGCSTGQEVWSLAMALAANGVQNAHVLGMDVSQKALDYARRGQYDGKTRAFIPLQYQEFIHPLEGNDDIKSGVDVNSEQQQLQSLPDNTAAPWQVSPKLRDHVDFIWHNIFADDLTKMPPPQVIICQNVLIYFRKFDQRDILTKLAKRCKVGGYIILAPAEGLSWRPKNMRKLQHPLVNVWQKISLES